ncbi:L,D-transpeptidase family protein [Halomonas sp. LS-001]
MNETRSIRRLAIVGRQWPLSVCLTLALGAPLFAIADDESMEIAFADALLLESAAVETVETVETTPEAVGDPAIHEALQRRDESSLLNAFYDQVNLAFLWHSERRVNALVDALEQLSADGLTPSDYAVGSLMEEYRASRSTDRAGKAAFDLDATQQLLTALTHLQNGKLDPRALNPRWDGPESQPLPLAEIAARLMEDDVAAAFDLARPAQAHYQQLRQALADYRAMEQQGSVALFPLRDASLRLGDQHDDVMALRQRLTYWGEPGLLPGQAEAYPELGLEKGSSLDVFDSELDMAVKRFQRRHLLEDDGIVGNNTRQALNASVSTRIDQLRINLERARWIQPVFEQEPRLWVDLAGYSMVYVRPSGEEWRSRVVVGSAKRETPVIHSQVTHLTVNPSWTLPPTIMREDVLPRLRRDPGYLARRNMHVVDFEGKRLSASSINWNSPGNIMIRQAAGSSNPLGSVVIRFPNSEMIYLHDTPSRGLFGRDQRALSSGCVRVEGVEELASMLLDDTGSKYQFPALKRSSRSDIQINLPQRIPVALHYLTAWPDVQGQVTFREDIYQRDQGVLRALDRVES